MIEPTVPALIVEFVWTPAEKFIVLPLIIRWPMFSVLLEVSSVFLTMELVA